MDRLYILIYILYTAAFRNFGLLSLIVVKVSRAKSSEGKDKTIVKFYEVLVNEACVDESVRCARVWLILGVVICKTHLNYFELAYRRVYVYNPENAFFFCNVVSILKLFTNPRGTCMIHR